MQKDYISQLVIDNRGFQGQDGVKTEKFTFTKYWDNFKTNGPITRVTENALEATKLLGPNIVIIITPYKKEWRESNKDIIEKEQVFQRKLYEISGKNKKIIIVNFFNTPFADSLFFDAIHLNRQGANILTRMLVDSLRRTVRAL